MTAAVPDPRFRDQSDEEPAWIAAFYQWAKTDKSPGSYSATFAAGYRAALAEVEARVQAAANQRAAEEVHAAAEALERDPVIADLVSRRAAGAAVDAAVTLVATRAAALASPAPAPHAGDGQ